HQVDIAPTCPQMFNCVEYLRLRLARFERGYGQKCGPGLQEAQSVWRIWWYATRGLGTLDISTVMYPTCTEIRSSLDCMSSNPFLVGFSRRLRDTNRLVKCGDHGQPLRMKLLRFAVLEEISQLDRQ